MALLGFAFGIALLSCGRDVTSPGANVRYARGIAWRTEFPPAYQQSGVVNFNRVRVVLHHSDGTIALDTVIDFPAGADSLPVTLEVKLLPSAPSTGELLSLNLYYINAADDTVFEGGPVGVTATPSSPGSAPPAAVTVPVRYTGPGASAVAVQISPRSGTVVSGSSFNFNAVAVDANGTQVPNTPIVWNTLDPSIASVPSAASGTVLAGNVRGTARIVAQLLTGPTDQVTLKVLPLPTTIAPQSGSGQSGLVGGTLANPLVAFVAASDGLGVGGVTVTFAVTSGGGSVGSATAVTNDAGLAQSTWQLGNTVGTQTVTASAGTLAGSPVTYTATARSLAPTKLTVTAQPANATAGATLATVTIVAQTASGDPASAFTGAVTLTLAGGTSGATLGGTTTVNAVGGVATFSNLTVSRSGTSYSLVASSSGLTNATTNSFDIAAGVAGKLVFTSQPSSSTAGVSVGTLAVTATDQFGNTVTGFTGLVTLAIASNPGAATFGGTTSANAIAGVATFGSVTLNRPGSGYTLLASATGLASATSASFDVAVGAAANIAAVAGVGQSGNLNATLPQPIVVQVQDLGGNGVAGTTVSFAVVTGGGSVLPASGVSNATGLVQSTWTLGATVGTQSISATSGGLGGSPLTINATGTSTLLHFTVTTSPAVAQVASVTVTPGFVVQAQDASNNPISTFTGTVSLAIGTNPGGGTLSGTTSVSAVAGVATFNAFSIDKAGTGYTVVASAAGYTSGVSSAFNIAAGPLATITVTPNPVSLNVNLTQQFTAIGKDASGNVVALTPVWSVAAGGGTISSSGLFVAGTVIGTFANTVTATSGGLSGTATVIVTTSGAVASTTVTPHLDTLTAIGATFALAAHAKDGSNNPVTGTFIWVSRTPAVDSVTVAGVVIAKTNGSSWIVATEAGGTKDSALIVVQQRLATINATPATRSIYLGASYTFTANAVDGLNVPLVTQPAITWSVQSSSIASVNASTGVATGVGLGSTQVKATSGAVTGVAVLTVNTPITAIYVSRDSAGFPTNANDVFTLTALGRTRNYRATARDTLGNAMTGITFTWTSTNASVAGLDSVTATTVRATAALNGVTSVTASAQGVPGAATLNVQQVLAAIHMTPGAAAVAPGGATPITAQGKDANGNLIAGGTFKYATSAPTVATVDSVTGIVTGVAPGTALVTATSGAIHSDTATVTVGTGVPATLSFGSSTLTIGRSATNVSIPVYLSKPSAVPVKVLLAVQDTFAFFSPTSITIPAGNYSANALLNGHNAGSTHVTATDSAGVYAATTSALAVQATVSLASSYYSLDVTDYVSTQILLSDPAPVGGTYVTVGFSTPGLVTVSPSPSFIPLGQLAADVVITAIAATGSANTSATPAASGVNGTASTIQTYPATIGTYPNSSILLGTGQYYPYGEVAVSAYLNHPLSIALSSSDSSKVSVPSSVVIGQNGNYNYFNISGLSVGSAAVTSSASGWTGASTASITITTPKVRLSGSTSLVSTSPASGVAVYVGDSTGNLHPRTNSLAIQLSSSDTNVLKVLTPSLTITPGNYANYSGLVIPGGAGGTAWLKVTASGHIADSTLYTVVGPKLSFYWTSNIIGAGQQDNYYYTTAISTPNAVTSPLTVSISNSDSTKVGLPTSIVIATGTQSTSFTVFGKSPGTATFIATALGYTPDTASYTVTTPHLVQGGGYTLNNFSGPASFGTYSTDSLRYSHVTTAPVIISYTSTNPSVLTVTGADTIQAGQSYTYHAAVTPVSAGTAKIVSTATGYLPDTSTWTVVQPQIHFNSRYATLGRRQYYPNTSFDIYTPNSQLTPLVATVTQLHPSVDSISGGTTLTIATGTNYAYFGFAGLAFGTDTLVLTAPGYLPDTAFFTVGTPHLYNYGIPSTATTTSAPTTVTVYAVDSLTYSHNVMDTLLVKATSSNIGVIQPTAAGFRIPMGSYYAQPQVAFTGPGTATMTYSDSLHTGYVATTTNAVTVTGPSLSFYNYTPVLGMRQNGGANSAYVTIPNSIATPLTVNLISTDTTVITVPASVVIPVGYTIAYFQVTAHDAVGTIQVQASATGYAGANFSSQVTAPKFGISSSSNINTTSPAQPIYVYAQDANGTSHNTNENVVVTLTSSSTASATIDSATVTIPAGSQSNYTAHLIAGAAGTTQLSASDARVQSYRYNTGTFNVAVSTPTLSLSSPSFTIGTGQYVDQNVFTPDNQPAGRTVNLTHFNASSTTPSSVSIPVNSSYTTYRTTGASIGTDTITFSAIAHNSVKGAVQVTAGQAYLPGWPSTLSLTGTDSVLVTVYAADANNTTHYVSAATTFTVSGVSHVSVNGGNPVVIPANSQYVQVYVKGITTGTDSSIQFAATGYTAQTISITVNP